MPNIPDTVFSKFEIRDNLSLSNIVYVKCEKTLEEKWIPVLGYEGLYEVSDLGRIKKIKREYTTKSSKTGFRTFQTMIIKQTKNPYGYLFIRLSDINNKGRLWFSHVIIARSFIENVFKKPCVNHLRGLKWDNRISELEWVTRSENQLHGYRLGLLKVNKTALGKKGALSPHAIKINQLSVDGEFVKEWSCQTEAAMELGLSQGNIGSVLSGKYKTTGGFKWEYSKNK